MRKTILKWLVLTFLLAYVAVVTVWAHGEAMACVCRGVEVEIASAGGIDTITSAGVKYELSKFTKKISAKRVDEINTRTIENYLSGFSNFENVECALTTTGKLKVQVVPMIPEIRVFDNDRSYYINKDGKKIEAKSKFFVDVPVVSGNFTESFNASDVLPLTRFIASDPVLNNLVSMVKAEGPRDLYLIPRVSGHVVNFGDTTRLAEKRDALLTFYRKVMPHKGWNEYDTISVKFRGQIVAGKRNVVVKEALLEDDDDILLEESSLPEAPTPTPEP